jgi:predicted RNA-binding protein with PIN domain
MTNQNEAGYNNNMEYTLEDRILLDYLEKDVVNAREDIREGKGLSQQGAMSMLLKGMYNHISHLDMHIKNMVTRSEFKSEITRLENKFDEKFEMMKWTMTNGFGIISVLITILSVIVVLK